MSRVNTNHKESEKEMTKTRDLRALLAVLAAMLLALIAGVMLVRSAGAEQQTVIKDEPFVVPASQVRYDTGIDLKAGDRLVVNAKGEVTACFALCGSNGPDGNTRDADARFPVNSGTTKEFGLIGEINDKKFDIGASYDGIPKDSKDDTVIGPGRLYLMVNDDNYPDNTGSFYGDIDVYRDVQTTTSPPTTSPPTTSPPTTPPNTPPTIDSMKPAPGSKIRNLAPLISATVQDAETDLSASNIKLVVDGSARTVSYDQASNQLTYKSAKLARVRHTVRIEATDEKGQQTVKDWSFSIVKKKHE
jgi:hypothetical protein